MKDQPGCINKTCQICTLARDVLKLAANGGMPDTYWQTDSRILRACGFLVITPDEARDWARKNSEPL